MHQFSLLARSEIQESKQRQALSIWPLAPCESGAGSEVLKASSSTVQLQGLIPAAKAAS